MNIGVKHIAFSILFSLVATFTAEAQCKSFTKRKCLPEMQPYLHNGQTNSTTMFEGETAKLLMTFYSGQDYRLLVCRHKLLESLYFNVKDTDDNLLYSSKESDDIYWDFTVNTTQQLVVEVVVPEPEIKHVSGIALSGCVSIVSGFRE